MAADSPVFEETCSLLEAKSDLDRLEVRGTIRIGLKSAGLDVHSVDAAQMAVMLRKILPRELETRGIDQANSLCDGIAKTIEAQTFAVTDDRAGSAAATLGRFGS
jgi:hypothetical protein